MSRLHHCDQLLIISMYLEFLHMFLYCIAHTQRCRRLYFWFGFIVRSICIFCMPLSLLPFTFPLFSLCIQFLQFVVKYLHQRKRHNYSRYISSFKDYTALPYDQCRAHLFIKPWNLQVDIP